MKKPVTDMPTSNEVPFDPFKILRSLNGPFADALIHSSDAVAENLESVNSEVLGFAGKRLRHNAETFRDFTKCSNFEDVVDLQRKWFQKASEHYTAEAGKIFGLHQKMMGKTVELTNEMSEAGKTVVSHKTATPPETE